MARMFPSNNPLDEAMRSMVVDELNKLLADSADLYAQTKHAHWNVQGEEFFMWHKLFDELADWIEDFADTIAERITALGGYALGTLRMAARSSRLPETPESVLGGNQFIEVLTNLYATHSQHLYACIAMCDEECEDEVTSNMLQEQAHAIDKAIYFLERHLIGGS